MSADTENSITEMYLPPELFGIYETYMMSEGVAFRGPIWAEDKAQDHPLDRVVSSALDHCLRNLTARTDPNIRYFWCIVEAQKPNASIVRLSDFYCVAVSSKLIDMFYHLATSLCADPDFAKYVIEGEPISPATDTPSRSRVEAIRHILTSEYDIGTGSAFAAATVVASQTFYFLAAHELGHAMGGHLASRFSSRSAIDEETLIASDAPEASRSLERDADGFAVGATIFRTIKYVEFKNHPVLKTAQDAIRLTLLSSYVFFCLMDAFRKPADLGFSSHPPAVVRMMTVVPFLISYLEFMGMANSHETCVEIVRQCIPALESTLLKQGGGYLTNEEVDRYFETAEGEWESHLKVWPKLVDELDRSELDALSWAAPIR